MVWILHLLPLLSDYLDPQSPVLEPDAFRSYLDSFQHSLHEIGPNYGRIIAKFERLLNTTPDIIKLSKLENRETEVLAYLTVLEEAFTFLLSMFVLLFYCPSPFNCS